MSEEILLASVQSLQNYFDEEIDGKTDERVKIWLTEKIVNLLLNDMEKLLSILYRIDVNEEKVKHAFELQNPKAIAPKIAELILERELEKAETRKKYHHP
jgi:hypothetical protein